MSQNFLSEEQFLCSICLDVFTNPVSTPCGHSFCMGCIGGYWKNAPACQCPICQQSYHSQPDLHVNRTLQEITEQFKRLSHVSVSPALHPLHPGGLPRDLLAEMKARLPKLSPGTVQYHPEGPSIPMRYSLSGPPESPAAPLCPAHRHPLELFCRNDQLCICTMCAEAEHRSHNILPAKREWLIKKSQIGIAEVEMKDLIQGKLRKVEEIQTALMKVQTAAEKHTADSMCVLTALMDSVEKSQAQMLERLQTERLTAEHLSQDLILQLEMEIADLRKRSTALSQLSQSEDYVLVLKSFSSLSAPLQTRDWAGVSVTSDLVCTTIFRRMKSLVQCFQEELEKLLNAGIIHAEENSLTKLQLKALRLQDFAVDVTLDAESAHPRLLLSADMKQVRCGDRHQTLPDTPQRFDRVVCVLGMPGFSCGRHYWEVEVGGKTDWDVGVASRSSSRKGKLSVCPEHGYWFLSLRDKYNYSFRTEPPTCLGLAHKPQKLGVLVDYERGQVSFYNVDTRIHIYTFIDSFSDIIYPFFSPCTNKSGKNDAPLIISPIYMEH